jgi:hypothetical protein
MKIRFRQSGGVTGLAKVAEVDAAAIPGDERGRLRAMVDEALTQAPAGPPPAVPDDELYHIEIEIEHRHESILIGRSSIPSALRPLVEYLERLAEYEKR